MIKAFCSLATSALVVGGLLSSSAFAAQDTLRIGIPDDPDLLDPAFNRTTTGRMVMYSICDRLFDVDPEGKIVPQLALSYDVVNDGLGVVVKLRPGVKFHDGEKLDAEAVKYTFERNLTLEGSGRRNDLSAVDRVEIVDPLTVKVVLKKPFSPLIAQFVDRAGVIVSPKAAESLGERFGNAPVCAGPYKMVERVQQDRIVLEKFADYWDADNVFIEKVTFRPVPDTTIRLTNLQAGTLDLIERVSPTQLPQIEGDQKLRVAATVDFGYQWIAFNVSKGDLAKGPLGSDPRVRRAFELSLDRNAINQVVFDGKFLPGNQWVNPKNPYYQEKYPVPSRDIDQAKSLMKEAGVKTPLDVDFMVANDPELRQVVEIIQAMASEAGFNVKLRATEHATAISEAQQGRFEAYIATSTGRLDPDGNVRFLHSKGAVANYGGYNNPEVDRLIDEAAGATKFEDRKQIYSKVADVVHEEVPVIYLYHRQSMVAHTERLQGFKATPDGMLKLVGLRFRD